MLAVLAAALAAAGAAWAHGDPSTHALEGDMLRKPQAYAEFVQTQLGGARMLDAPLVVITPYGIGVAGRELRGGELRRVDGRDLVRGIAVSRTARGNALAAAASAAVRRIARLGGRPLPAHVAPASAVWTGSSASSGGSVHVPLAVIAFAVLFGVGWALYELWSRFVQSDRRRVHESL